MGLVEGEELGALGVVVMKPHNGHTTPLLSTGYDSMGYEMSKPDLRAELEADLKLICEGKKDKLVVLHQQVQKYKQVFIEAVAKARK